MSQQQPVPQSLPMNQQVRELICFLSSRPNSTKDGTAASAAGGGPSGGGERAQEGQAPQARPQAHIMVSVIAALLLPSRSRFKILISRSMLCAFYQPELSEGQQDMVRSLAEVAHMQHGEAMDLIQQLLADMAALDIKKTTGCGTVLWIDWDYTLAPTFLWQGADAPEAHEQSMAASEGRLSGCHP